MKKRMQDQINELKGLIEELESQVNVHEENEKTMQIQIDKMWNVIMPKVEFPTKPQDYISSEQVFKYMSEMLIELKGLPRERFSCKIAAIKFVRAMTGMGLKDSKDYIDNLWAKNGIKE